MKRWMTIGWLAAALLGATGIANSRASAAPPGSPACQTMLDPDFTWASKPPTQGYGYGVAATLTVHSPKDRDEDRNDYVLYAEGSLQPTGTGAQQVLRGTLYAHDNYTPNAANAFRSVNVRFDVTVTRTGQVTIQQKIDNSNYLGRGPEIYQATCGGGLLTAVVDQTQGLRSHTLSLTQHQWAIIN